MYLARYLSVKGFLSDGIAAWNGSFTLNDHQEVKGFRFSTLIMIRLSFTSKPFTQIYKQTYIFIVRSTVALLQNIQVSKTNNAKVQMPVYRAHSNAYLNAHDLTRNIYLNFLILQLHIEHTFQVCSILLKNRWKSFLEK